MGFWTSQGREALFQWLLSGYSEAGTLGGILLHMESTCTNGADAEESKDKRWLEMMVPKHLDPSMPEAAYY